MYAAFDGLLDVFPHLPSAFKYATLTMSIIMQGLSLPGTIATGTADEWLFYVAQVFPIVLTIREITLGDPLSQVIFQKVAPFVNCAYGIAMIATSITLAVKNKPGFRGKNYISMTQNIFSFLPYVFKPLGVGDIDASPQNIALGVIDTTSDLTAVGLEFAQLIDS